MIAKFLATLKQNGWKQRRLAEIVGVTESHISKLLDGEKCSVDVVLKLADYFGVTADEVLGRQVVTEIKKPVKRDRVTACKASSLTS